MTYRFMRFRRATPMQPRGFTRFTRLICKCAEVERTDLPLPLFLFAHAPAHTHNQRVKSLKGGRLEWAKGTGPERPGPAGPDSAGIPEERAPDSQVSKLPFMCRRCLTPTVDPLGYCTLCGAFRAPNRVRNPFTDRENKGFRSNTVREIREIPAFNKDFDSRRCNSSRGTPKGSPTRAWSASGRRGCGAGGNLRTPVLAVLLVPRLAAMKSHVDRGAGAFARRCPPSHWESQP